MCVMCLCTCVCVVCVGNGAHRTPVHAGCVTCLCGESGVCTRGCVWCGVCMVCSCRGVPCVYVHGGPGAARRGPRWWQQLRRPGRGLHLSPRPHLPTPHLPGWRLQKLRCRNSISSDATAAAERGGGGEERVRGAGSQPKGGGASSQRLGGTWQPGPGRGKAWPRPPEPTTPENTPRCDDEVKEPELEVGAREVVPRSH